MDLPESVLSDHIRAAMLIALDAGNHLTTISSDWKPRQVLFMDRPLSQTTKADIEAAHPDLEYFANEPTPHNPATEGFIDHAADVVLTFPARGEQRRWYPSFG